MIKFTEGNLLDADTEALVNTVNTVGVMSQGIALMFKEAFPHNTEAYEAACKNKAILISKMFVTSRTDFIGPKWIINFLTREHWRHPSRMEWIASGLSDLRQIIVERRIKSIAIPPLGAGDANATGSRPI